MRYSDERHYRACDAYSAVALGAAFFAAAFLVGVFFLVAVAFLGAAFFAVVAFFVVAAFFFGAWLKLKLKGSRTLSNIRRRRKSQIV